MDELTPAEIAAQEDEAWDEHARMESLLLLEPDSDDEYDEYMRYTQEGEYQRELDGRMG